MIDVQPDILRQSLAHAEVPALAMPIGGIGTGGFAVNADGSMRQWQLSGMPNHRGALPGTGFWIRATQIEPPVDFTAMLQGAPVEDPRAPLVTDGEIPPWMSAAAEKLGTFQEARFSGTYPIAEVDLKDERSPVEATVRFVNPMEPGNVELSGIPGAMIEIRLTNVTEIATHGTLAGSLLNAVGWDGVTPIAEITPGLGGNVNRLRRSNGWTSVVMDNPTLAETSQFAGQMILSADAPDAAAVPRCSGIDHLGAFLESRALNDGHRRVAQAPTIGDPQLNAPASGVGPSAPGSSWTGVIGVPFHLEPGESRSIRFVLAWHFPNRMVDIEQFGHSEPQWGTTKFYLGNSYALAYPDAVAVQERLSSEWHDLSKRTSAWTRTLVDSDLDARAIDRMAAQASLVRSPTCFIGADGRFYGYEGSLGASTRMWSGSFGGSCPLNCTHVWQYEAALAALWPELERNMRDTEFDVMQSPSGAIPHRLRVPTYLPQMHDELIGGPEEPALDGMLATILKTLRDVQHGAGQGWAEARWPAVVKLYQHIVEKWDHDGDGVLHGIQPSTHDIDLAGINPFMGTLWLAALRALEQLATLVGDDEIRSDARGRFVQASDRYDSLLFRGGQYIQIMEEGDPTDFQWVTGTLSDQVIGQWWAHQLGLGYILPREHIRSALRHIVKTNLRRGFVGFEHPYRVYADSADDAGLLMCSWPEGGRPEVPTRYADEVWCGVEYQVAAHCLYEGLYDEAQNVLDALWTRTDGARRNPYNDIECGDHYSRAMSGWTVLQAQSGIHIDERAGKLSASREGRWPWVASTGFGTVTVAGSEITVTCSSGRLDLELERTNAGDETSAGLK